MYHPPEKREHDRVDQQFSDKHKLAICYTSMLTYRHSHFTRTRNFPMNHVSNFVEISYISSLDCSLFFRINRGTFLEGKKMSIFIMCSHKYYIRSTFWVWSATGMKIFITGRSGCRAHLTLYSFMIYWIKLCISAIITWYRDSKVLMLATLRVCTNPNIGREEAIYDILTCM